MKVAIIGYGKMGKAIGQILERRGHEVIARFGKEGIHKSELARAEVAIEFSRPEAVFSNITTCFEMKIPVVCGTTGWLDKYDEAVKLCRQNGSAFLYASNFSLGVNIFFEINKTLARIMNSQENYDVSMEEIHHTQKLDAPSGTAITLAGQIIQNLDNKQSWTLDKEHQPDQIYIDAQRIENVPGTHTVRYQSSIDSIEIKHTAHGREGFALGAVLAAEFLQGKSGIFTMKDVLNL